MTNENAIFVQLSGTCWIAHFCGPIADEIESRFGTIRIPTAFTDKAKAHEVRRALKAKYPQAHIETI